MRRARELVVAVALLILVTEGAQAQDTAFCPCTKEYNPVCGSNGQTYPNKCTAACELGKDGVWGEGSCDELNPFAGCLGNARCKRDACADPCADATPGSVCFMNTCTGQELNGTAVDACAAIWVDPITKAVAVCGSVDPPADETSQEQVSCASSATVKCFADPCGLPPPADCAAANEPGATCESVSCIDGTLPDGTKVLPCTAVWRSPAGTLSSCPVKMESSGPDATDSTDTNSTEPKDGCVCPLMYAPVCSADNTTYSSACEAGCVGAAVAYKGECSADGADGCACIDIYEPVCGSDGQMYENECRAKCSGVEVGSKSLCVDFSSTDGSSGSTTDGGSGSTGGSTGGGAGEGCVCPMFYSPVCSADNKTYSNLCEATCAGAVVASYGKCGSPAYDGSDGVGSGTGSSGGGKDGSTSTSVSVSCAEGDTVACFADPCKLSSCPANPSAICVASYCSNGTLLGQPTGPCEALYVDGAGNIVDCSGSGKDGSTDDSGNSSTSGGSSGEGDGCACIAMYAPVCGEDGKTYGNSCAASCAHVAVAHEGECPPPSVSCAKGDTVACFADPCSVSSCPANPAATCVASYCSNGTLLGRPTGPCEALYVDGAGNIVDCGSVKPTDEVVAPAPGKPGIVTDIHKCPAGSPRVMCAAGLLDACSKASCPGNPSATCVTKNCAATYRGQELLPCSPIWVDPKTGDLANCTARPACANCPRDYKPVCGADGKNYPNQCSADCLGKRVKRAGKCHPCKGEECTIGKKNDLCIRGAPKQCWDKKYSCQLPPGGKKADFLGVCLPKPSSSSSTTTTSSVSVKSVKKEASKKESKKGASKKASRKHHHRHHRHMLEHLEADA